MTSEVKMPVEAIREALELACDLANAELVRAQESFKGYPKKMQPAEADELVAAFGLASLDALLAQHVAAIEAARVEARAKALEEAADICEKIADGYQRTEGRNYPELRSDAETGASSCEYAIRAAASMSPDLAAGGREGVR